MADGIDSRIRELWPTHRTMDIASSLGLAERSVRWRARRLGLPPHPRGRKSAAAPAVAEMRQHRPVALPIQAPRPSQLRVRLPQEYEAFRPGDAPRLLARRE